jgi:hypothetical protein
MERRSPRDLVLRVKVRTSIDKNLRTLEISPKQCNVQGRLANLKEESG